MDTKFIPITKPFFDSDEIWNVEKAIKSGWVCQGPLVAEFEKQVALYSGARYAVATSSCTTALHLALLCMGIGAGDEVIVPSYTFIATANSVLYTGAKPVFVDIDDRTYNIDLGCVKKAITRKTKAIIAVHQAGLPCDMDGINSIADKKNIHVLEDAACAIGCEYKGKRIGSISRISCFSFHPRKVITTGEGGMITTQDEAVYKSAQMLRSHGASVSDLARHKTKKVTFETYPLLGYNYRMTDVQAAMGLAQLKKLDFIINRRRVLAGRYIKALSSSEFIAPPYIPDYVKHNFQSFIIRIKPGQSRLTRDGLMSYLLDKGIATRRGVMAIHKEPYYVKMFKDLKLPVTQEAVRSTIILPLFPQMTYKEQDRVIEEVKKGIKTLIK